MSESVQTRTDPEPTSKLERLAVTLALCMCLLPCVTAIILECAHPELRRLLTGDEAVFEVQVMTLLDAPPLVGPYSRHGWHHPGPLAFFVLGIPAALTGHAVGATNVVTGIFNALCLALIAALGWRLTRGAWQRAVLLVFTTLLAVEVSGTFPPFGQSGLTTAWNPIFTLLPFAALLLANVHVALRDARALLVSVFLHAFITQSHLAYVPIATLTLVLSLAYAHKHATQESRAAFKRLGVSAAVLGVVLWSPVLLDTLFGAHNMLDVLRFFFAGGETFHVSFAEAISVLASRTSAPLLGLIASSRHAPHTADTVDYTLLALILAGLVAGLVRHRSTRPPQALLAASLLLAFAIGFASIFRTDHPEYPYLTWWIGILGILGAMTALIVHLPETPARAPYLASIALSLLLSGEALHTSLGTYPTLLRQVHEREEALGPFLPWLEQTYARHPDAYLALGRGELWQEIGGVLVHLRRAGHRPRIELTWAFMFGEGASTQSAHEEEGLLRITLSDRFPRASELAFSSPSRWLSVPLEAGAGEAVEVSREGEVTRLRLPVSRNNGVRITGLDGTREVQVEGSLDHVHFHALGLLPSATAEGARPFAWNDGKAWRELRWRTPGDVTAQTIEARGVLLDVGTQEARPFLREGWSTDEADAIDTFVWALGERAVVRLPPLDARRATVFITLVPFATGAENPELTVDCAGQTASLALPPRLDTLAFDLESTAFAQGAELVLTFSHFASPQSLGYSEDARSLAAAVHRIEVRPRREDIAGEHAR